MEKVVNTRCGESLKDTNIISVLTYILLVDVETGKGWKKGCAKNEITVTWARFNNLPSVQKRLISFYFLLYHFFPAFICHRN